MMFLKFKNGYCKNVISLDKITCIKSVEKTNSIGKYNHFIEFDNGKYFEIDDKDYNSLIRFFCENNLLAEIV